MTALHPTHDAEQIARTLNLDVLPENAIAKVEHVPKARAVVYVDGLFEREVRRSLWNTGFKNEPVAELAADVEQSAIVVCGVDERFE